MALYSFSTDRRVRCAADYKSVFDGALFKVHQPHFYFLQNSPNSLIAVWVLLLLRKKCGVRMKEIE